MAAQDLIIAIVIIFAFGVGYLSFHYGFDKAVDTAVNISIINSSAETVTAFKQGQTLSNRLDYVVFTVFIVLAIGIMISGYFVGGNPLYMFFFFLVMVIATIIASVLHYAWDTVSGASIFITSLTAFPLTNHILTHIEIYTPVIGFLGFIAMFIRPFVVRE
jgi:hypothetical protein